MVTHLSTDQVKSCLTLQSTLAILEKCQISQITFISYFSRFKNTSPFSYSIIKLIWLLRWRFHIQMNTSWPQKQELAVKKKVLLTWVVREDLILPRALRVLSASSICFSRSAFSTDNFFFVMSASASEVCKSSRRWVLSPMSPCKALFCFSRVVWNRDLHIECSKQFKWGLYFLGRAGRFGQC